jgi:tetratricopeptide (TPR) repeat protein
MAPALKVLLDQAKYWQARNRLDLAQHALDRALRLDPRNPAALAMLAQVQAAHDDWAAARTDDGSQPAKHPDDNARAVTAIAPLKLVPVGNASSTQEENTPSYADRPAYKHGVSAPAAGADDPPVRTAVLRQPNSAREPHITAAVGLAMLRRNPSNLDARRAAVEGAIKDGDWLRADAITREGVRLAPNDPRAWLILAELHRARGDDVRAMSDLKTAEDLRRQQRGSDQPSTSPDDAAIYEVVSIEPSVAPVSSNPFRTNTPPIAETMTAQVMPTRSMNLPGTLPSDQMSAQIDAQIAALHNEMAPKFMLGAGLVVRTGTAGLSKLNEETIPLEAVFAPGVGQLTFRATPTFLSAGQLGSSTTSLRQFGSGALGNGTVPPSQNAAGFGLGLEYALKWFKADIGTSPLGFPEQNVIGGIELSPALNDNLRLRVVGERRPVTDSVLAYAGTKDPSSGTTWGGVTRTRGHGQLEVSAGLANLYAGGGYSSLDGSGVAQNQEIEAGAGGSYPIWRNSTDELRMGLDLVYFAYNKNLSGFTLGQGGYFSPQSFFASLIPITYGQKLDDLTWLIGGSVGYQTYSQHSSAVFPNNPGLQNALNAKAATDSTIATSYPGTNGTGIAGGARGELEYRVNHSLWLGGRASFQHVGDWSELQAMLYLRYIFNYGAF